MIHTAISDMATGKEQQRDDECEGVIVSELFYAAHGVSTPLIGQL